MPLVIQVTGAGAFDANGFGSSDGFTATWAKAEYVGQMGKSSSGRAFLLPLDHAWKKKVLRTTHQPPMTLYTRFPTQSNNQSTGLARHFPIQWKRASMFARLYCHGQLHLDINANISYLWPCLSNKLSVSNKLPISRQFQTAHELVHDTTHKNAFCAYNAIHSAENT